jgi:hypothetical protein
MVEEFKSWSLYSGSDECTTVQMNRLVRGHDLYGIHFVPFKKSFVAW